MSLSDKDRDLVWSAVYTAVMAYEHGEVPLEKAKDIVEAVCVLRAVASIVEEK